MKKLMVYFLAAALVLTMLPLSALAEGGYALTYDGNGADSGSVPADTNFYNAGDTVTVSANTGMLAKTGFAFSGWNTAADGSGAAYAESSQMTMPDSNVTLFAQWTPIPCTVKFDARGGTPVPDWTGNYGDTIAAAPASTYEGYDFFGWYADPFFITPVSFPHTVTHDATFYAKWQPVSAWLSNIVLSGGTLSRDFVKTAYSYKLQLAETESSVTITPVPENSNAKIAIWTNRDRSVSSGGLTVNVENNKTVTVKIKVTYTAAAAEGTEAETLCHVYTIVVKRAKSTDATLASLTASAGTLSPAFDPAVRAYVLNIGASVKSVTLTAVANSPCAKLKNRVTYRLREGQQKTARIRVRPQFGPALVYTVKIIRERYAGGADAAGSAANNGGNGGNNGNNGNKGGSGVKPPKK